MPHLAQTLIGISSYDDDSIAHMLKQITGFEVFTFNEAFSEDHETAPLIPMIVTNINEHREASYIRSLGGAILNAPCDGRKVLNPEEDDFILEVTSDMGDAFLYQVCAKFFEECLVEHEE